MTFPFTKNVPLWICHQIVLNLQVVNKEKQKKLKHCKKKFSWNSLKKHDGMCVHATFAHTSVQYVYGFVVMGVEPVIGEEDRKRVSLCAENVVRQTTV